MLDDSRDAEDLGLLPPPGFTSRRPTFDDLDAVTRLIAAATRDRAGTALLRTEDLRTRWLAMDEADQTVLIERPGAVEPLVAYAAFETDLDPYTGELAVHVDGAVHPAWTAHGIGGFLLAHAARQARRAARAHGLDGALLRTALTGDDPGTESWLTARGFVPVRHLLELRLDLHAPPPTPAWPTGITCRPYRPGHDDTLLWRTHQAAFADVPTHDPMTHDELLDHRIHDDAFDPGLVLLAEHDTEVVGVMIGRAGTPVAAEDGWVRDLGVVPAFRRRGVGMALLRTAFAAFRERELTGVALEVDDVTLTGAVALYRRAGMRIVQRTDVLERRLSVHPG